MTIRELEDGVFVNTAKAEKIKNLDAVIFDCDGVLIDVTNSYDLAIKKTVEFVLKEMASIDQPNIISSKMIDGLKATGGFNDEVDATYSLILSVVAAKKLDRHASEFIFDVIKNADQTGIVSVEKYLDTLGVDISEIRKKLAYPGPHDTNPLYDVFDIKNSRFLEDESREFAKPNPQPLISSIKGLHSSCCMFVGDSVEDIIMARKSDELGVRTIFCAIYGTSKDPETKRILFEQKNADIILKSIDLIPKALNLVDRK